MANSPEHNAPAPPSLFNLPEGLSPDSIDILPVLSAVLSRLKDPSTATASTSGSPPAASPSQLTSGSGPLTIKDIPAATDELKHKLHRAKLQIKELPDIDRTIQEQEEEIAEWEDKIRRQRETLEALKQVGLAAKMEREERTRAASGESMKA
jgi:hypothetical protein